MSKAERKAEALQARERRRAASDEIMASRIRTAIGFGAAYVGTQILPQFAPTLAANQSLVDLALGGVGAYFALTDDGEIGDYALGAAMVGATQTLDRVSTTIEEWLAREPAAA